MPEFDLQAARILKAPQIRPGQGLVGDILNYRFSDYLDNVRFGLIQQESAFSTSSNAILLDIDAAEITGTAEWGCVVTHMLAQRTSAGTLSATVSFGTNSTTFDNWHSGISLSSVANGEWTIIYPRPGTSGYGVDTPAGGVKKVRTADTSHDEFRARLVSGTWSATFDFYIFGYYWRETA